jgi:hypothetical protein
VRRAPGGGRSLAPFKVRGQTRLRSGREASPDPDRPAELLVRKLGSCREGEESRVEKSPRRKSDHPTEDFNPITVSITSSLETLDRPTPSGLPSRHLGSESRGGDAIQAYAELICAFWAAHRRATSGNHPEHKEAA